MTSTGSTEFTATSETQSVWSRAARLLRGRVGLVALGAAVLGIGGALNWHWLVAAGIAPLVLSVLPCVVMCSLGLCMAGMANRGASAQQSANSDPAVLPPGGASCCAPEPAANQLTIDAPQR